MLKATTADFYKSAQEILVVMNPHVLQLLVAFAPEECATICDDIFIICKNIHDGIEYSLTSVIPSLTFFISRIITGWISPKLQH